MRRTRSLARDRASNRSIGRTIGRRAICNIELLSSCSLAQGPSWLALSKKSLVNWDQDVTPRARGRIGTRVNSSYTCPTGSLDALRAYARASGARIRAVIHTHTQTRVHARYSVCTARNNKRRAILINYLSANYCNYMLPHPPRTLSNVLYGSFLTPDRRRKAGFMTRSSPKSRDNCGGAVLEISVPSYSPARPRHLIIVSNHESFLFRLRSRAGRDSREKSRIVTGQRQR